MTLTTAQQVRSRISDPFRWDSEQWVSDGYELTHKLHQGAPFSNLSASSYTAFVGNPPSATGATFDPALGIVIFVSAQPTNTPMSVTYIWSVFSEDEMEIFTGHGPDVPSMALEAVKTLMSDFSRRARWSAPDGSSYDDATTYQNLADLRKALIDEIRGSETGPAGEFFSQAETQQDWGA